MQILYVDDDRINLMLFEHACSALSGLRLRTAADGAEAMTAVLAQRPDVMVIDLNLPDTDGYALLQSLRAQGDLTDTPAFLCTADPSPLVRQAAMRAGFQGCWAKPVGHHDLGRELATLGLAPRGE